MKTICNECYEICSGRQPGFNCLECPNQNAGTLLDIAYLDFTSPIGVTLYRNEFHETLFMESFFCKNKIDGAPCRVVGEDYIEDLPQFIPVYPVPAYKVPVDIRAKYITEGIAKIQKYNKDNIRQFNCSYTDVRKLIFKQKK